MTQIKRNLCKDVLLFDRSIPDFSPVVWAVFGRSYSSRRWSSSAFVRLSTLISMHVGFGCQLVSPAMATGCFFKLAGKLSTVTWDARLSSEDWAVQVLRQHAEASGCLEFRSIGEVNHPLVLRAQTGHSYPRGPNWMTLVVHERWEYDKIIQFLS